MSEKEESGCDGKSCRRRFKGPRARTHCPKHFCKITLGTDGCGADTNQKRHHHDSGACPYLEKIRKGGCSVEDKEKSGCECVPQECATWMCGYYYTMGRHGGYQPWGQDQEGFVQPCFGDSESSESEEESAKQEGMETEGTSSEGPGAETKEGETVTANEEKCEGNPDTKDSVPMEFLQCACWAYYMLGTNEAGGPPHMGPWGQQFGPRLFMHQGFGPHGLSFMHSSGDEMGGYGPFVHRGDFGHHHPRGHHHHGHHGHHGHGPPFLFPGMGGFGGMFGFPNGDWRHGHCHGGSRGGRFRGRGGFRGHGGPPCCPRMCQTKAGKEDTNQKTE